MCWSEKAMEISKGTHSASLITFVFGVEQERLEHNYIYTDFLNNERQVGM